MERSVWLRSSELNRVGARHRGMSPASCRYSISAAPQAGFEPASPGLEDRCLSVRPLGVASPAGIEPTLPASHAGVLSIELWRLVSGSSSPAPAEGLEPPSTWFEARRLSFRPRGHWGVPGEIRTHASWLRTRPPGPLVRRGQRESSEGFEPSSIGLQPTYRACERARWCGQRESSPPFLLGTQVCVHQHFDRDRFARRRGIEPRPTDLESVWSPCPPA